MFQHASSIESHGGAWLAVARNRRNAWETVSEGLVQSISERMLYVRLDAYV